MSTAEKVAGSVFYVADKRPVIAFNTKEDALAFQKSFSGAEIYGNKTHVFLPTPYGLEFVRGGMKGETAYVFHFPEQAHHWFERLKGCGAMYPDGEYATRSVFIGSDGLSYEGTPTWPGLQ